MINKKVINFFGYEIKDLRKANIGDTLSLCTLRQVYVGEWDYQGGPGFNAIMCTVHLSKSDLDKFRDKKEHLYQDERGTYEFFEYSLRNSYKAYFPNSEMPYHNKADSDGCLKTFLFMSFKELIKERKLTLEHESLEIKIVDKKLVKIPN